MGSVYITLCIVMEGFVFCIVAVVIVVGTGILSFVRSVPGCVTLPFLTRLSALTILFFFLLFHLQKCH